jgi:hypothetical protein
MSTQKLLDLTTSDQIAHELGITTRTLFNWQKHGLPVITIGKARRYHKAHVEAWLLSREKNSPAAQAAA